MTKKFFKALTRLPNMNFTLLSNLFNRTTINNNFYGDVDLDKVKELNQAQMAMLMGLDVKTQDTEPQSEDCEKNPNP